MVIVGFCCCCVRFVIGFWFFLCLVVVFLCDGLCFCSGFCSACLWGFWLFLFGVRFSLCCALSFGFVFVVFVVVVCGVLWFSVGLWSCNRLLRVRGGFCCVVFGFLFFCVYVV